MSTRTYVIRDDSVVAGQEVATVLIGLPWYRSLPWAGVAGLTVAMNGVVETDPLVGGQTVGRLSTREDYWFLQHRARVSLPSVPPPAPGEQVEVSVRLELRIPGPLKPDGSPMDFVFEDTRTLRVPG